MDLEVVEILGPQFESQSKPGTKMVNPEPCFKNQEGGRNYFWLGLPFLTFIHPGFDCGSFEVAKPAEKPGRPNGHSPEASLAE